MQLNKILLLITLLSPSLSHSQIPSNFEFLNHSDINVETTQLEIWNSKIIALNNKGIDLISPNTNKLEKVYTLGYNFYSSTYSKEYDLIIENDTVAHLIAWDIQDLDVNLKGPIITTITNNDISTTSYVLSMPIPFTEKIMDLTYDSTEGWWIVTDKSLYHIKEDIEIAKYDAFWDLVNTKLHTSCDGEIYLLDVPYLYKVNDGNFEPNFVTTSAGEIKIKDNHNYVLFGNDLAILDCKFEEELHTWTLPFHVNNFKQVKILEDNKLMLCEHNQQFYKIYLVDESSNSQIIYESEADPNETISGIKILSDSTYIIYGLHAFGIFEQPYYRVKNINQTINYQKAELEIIEFNIDYTLADPVYNSSLDSIIEPIEFQPKISAFNVGGDSINQCHIYSKPYLNLTPGILPYIYNIMTLTQSIPPQNLGYLEGFTSIMTIDLLEQLEFELTGADYKFLQNGPRILKPDLISSNTYIEKTKRLEIVPNPANAQIKISSKNLYDIRIINNIGEVQLENKTYTKNSLINIGHLQKGIYFIHAKDENGDHYLDGVLKL